MAWIESHQSLERHPKTLGVMSIMGWNVKETIGTLHIFWWWCIDYAPDGDLRKHSNAVLAVAAGLSPTEGDQFVNAMLECRGKDGEGNLRPGFLEKDPYFRLRNWWKRAGRFLQARYKSDPAFLEKIKSSYVLGRNKVESDSQQLESPFPQTPLTPRNQSKPNQETYTGSAIPGSSTEGDQKPPPDALMNLWNTNASPKLPRAKALSDKRRKKCISRLVDHPDIHFWVSLIEKINKTPFLLGETKAGSWRIDFDFIIESEHNILKILEGKYDNVGRN